MTIKDIARESGYSIGTVSRVLNNSSSVSETARKRVLEVVEKNNFQLNSYAKTLKQRRGDDILIIVKGSSNMLFAALLESMQKLVEEAGYPLRVSYIDEYENEVLRARRQCEICSPRGIIFLGSEIENFERDFEGIEPPCVIATNSAESLHIGNLSSVATDDRLAAKTAMEYLFDLGHEKIGILGGTSFASRPVYRRYQGIKEAFAERGLSFDPDVCYKGARFALEDGYNALNHLLNIYPEMTAVLTMSDMTAIGAIRALGDRGLQVPEDISVFGFDGVELSEYTNPRLTTVRQNKEEISRRCVEILLEQIRTGNIQAVYETAPFRIVKGESVARLE